MIKFVFFEQACIPKEKRKYSLYCIGHRVIESAQLGPANAHILIVEYVMSFYTYDQMMYMINKTGLEKRITNWGPIECEALRLSHYHRT